MGVLSLYYFETLILKFNLEVHPFVLYSIAIGIMWWTIKPIIERILSLSYHEEDEELNKGN
jgi:hypothetical protein